MKTLNRVPSIRQLMNIRHGIDIPRKTLYARVKDQDVKRQKSKLTTSSVVAFPPFNEVIAEKTAKPENSRQTNFSIPLPRPQLELRDVAGIEEMLQLNFLVRATEGGSKISCSFKNSSDLVMAPGVPSRLLRVDLSGDSISNLRLLIVSPWVFSPQWSTMTVSDGVESRKRESSIPMYPLDQDDDRKTICEMGVILGTVLPGLDVNSEH